jgi:hypothetical protein
VTRKGAVPLLSKVDPAKILTAVSPVDCPVIPAAMSAVPPCLTCRVPVVTVFPEITVGNALAVLSAFIGGLFPVISL